VPLALTVASRGRLVKTEGVVGLVVSRVLAALALAAFALGVTYVAVACESLPSFLGGVPGDTHPRTPLGVALLIAAVMFAAAAYASRRPSTKA
jgi:hypothetical protein